MLIFVFVCFVFKIYKCVTNYQFFTVYIDVLLEQLKNQRIGCHIGKLFTGALAYADDVVLLAPSLSSLRKMLLVCEQFSDKFDIKFNFNKSKLIVYGNNPAVNIMFKGNIIPMVQTEKHLGHLVGNYSDINKCKIVTACNQAVGKLNFILSQLSNCNPKIMYRLFKNYALFMYGSQLWNYSSDTINNVSVMWRKCVRKIFRIPYNTHCSLISPICNDYDLVTQLHRRFLRFFISSLNSKNIYVKTACNLVLQGSASDVCDSVTFICNRYNLCRFNLSAYDVSKIVDSVNTDNDIISHNAGIINDFLILRDQNPMDRDIQDIITYLCTV